MAITIGTGPDTASLPRVLRNLTRGWTTPRRIRTITAGVLIVTVVLGVVIGTVMTTVRDGVGVIGGQAAPLAMVSTDLSFEASDMDAQVANVLLVGNDQGLIGNLQGAISTYDQRRSQADADLQQLVAIGASDATVQREVGIVLDQMERYEWAAGQIFLLEQRDASPAGRPAADVLDLYRQDTDAMRGILTSVQYLTDSNHDLLNNTYLADRSATVAARVWVSVLGIGLVLVLLALQRYFRTTMRRRINPALLLATVATGILTITAFAVLSDEDGHLTVAKSSAFDSIVALAQARAVSHDANADESRYLADPGRAGQYQDAFVAKSLQLADLPGAGLSTYDQKLDAALRQHRGNSAEVGFGGFFGTELHNITFPGEAAATDQTLTQFQAFERDDRMLRRLNTGGDLPAAVAFKVGATPGNLDYDFGQYDAVLSGLIGLNQRAFDATINEANNQLDNWTDLIPVLGVLLIGGLAVLGTWPRLAEYR